LEGKPIGQDDQAAAAQELSARYRCAVLLKGGHLVGDPVDILFENGEIYRWKHPRLENVNTHGSGCMLAAAITAHLAHGKTLREAVEKGLDAVHQVLAYPVEPAPGLALAGIESLRS
jgi:hydroxymethylpyrimidine/phosphomethylpyrimidine kinase